MPHSSPIRPTIRSRRGVWRTGLMALCLLGLGLLSGCNTLPAATDTGAQAFTTPTGDAPAATAAPRSRRPVLPADALQPIQTGSAYSLTVTSLTPPSDLWDRIRRGFGMPDLESDLVQDRVDWYAARPDYVFRMTERSRKYMFHIVEELERRDMPTELALLPFIESAFNPQAVSSAKAAGMWQFMPATGKDFDLKQNIFRDDRRDVLASTRAALDYLQMLHDMFNDWHLALAAYNWGQGSVKKAIERNQKKGLPTGYTDLTMPMETRMYVPKLQAVKHIVASPASHGVRLPLIENHPFFDTVTLDRDIDVSLAARLAELNEDDFRALNPSIHRPVILASGTPNILLPWDNAAIFKRNLQFHMGPQATWTAWAVPSSMRTAEIAKRFNMPESDLRSLNKIPPGMLVKAGSTLLVPRLGQTAQQEVPEHLADNAHIDFQPEKVVRRSSAKARKGDTIESMARRHQVSAGDLASWNKLSPKASLKAGQSLTLLKEVMVVAARSPRDNREHTTVAKPTPSRKAVPAKSSRQTGSGKPTRIPGKTKGK